MRLASLKHLPFILLALAGLALAACQPMAVGGSALGIWATKTNDRPPADTADQIAPHENWCYNTMGYAECYAHPQPSESNRLINVDPANRYPLTRQGYDQIVADDRAPPTTAAPADLPATVPPPAVQPAMVTPDIAVTPPPVMAPKPVVKPKHKKHKPKHKPKSATAAPKAAPVLPPYIPPPDDTLPTATDKPAPLR